MTQFRLGQLAAGLALFLAVLSPAAARAQSDVIRGHVTNVDDMPLMGVRVTAISIPGNVTRETRTDKKGNFQIVFPGSGGDYMMGYALIGYVYRQVQVKRLADEDFLVANARLEIIQLDTISINAPVRQKVGRGFGDQPDIGGTEQRIDPRNLSPDAQGNLAALAASVPGVLLVPGVNGGPDGFSVLGLGADENSITLNGLQFSGSGLPRDARVMSSLTTSPYDVSRGGFSGANLNLHSMNGSNTRTRGVSSVLQAPQLMWTDRAASALGQQYTNVSIDATLAGPLVRNKAFYNMTWELNRHANDNNTLLGTSAIGLRTAGVSADSVSRLLSILQLRGVPGLSGPLQAQQVNNSGSVFGNVSIAPPGWASGQSFTFNFNGQWGKQSPVGGGATQLGSAAGDRLNWGAGIQGSHTAYVKFFLTETMVGVNTNESHGDPYLDLPSGQVRVMSFFPDGSSGVRTLTFGGNQGLSSRSAGSSYSFSNNLSWFDEQNKHRLKLHTEATYRSSSNDPQSNMLGTFTYNSLEDLENGVPATFTRTLFMPKQTSGLYTVGASLGDAFRSTQDFQLTYGVRADISRSTERPAFNPAVQAAFGKRNDRVPFPIGFSPRVGFSWTLGTADEIYAFTNAARRPRATLRGGIGVISAADADISGAIQNTGLPSSTQQILCVGPAAPYPSWDLYDDPTLIPSQCADGSSGSVFSASTPSVTMYAPSWKPARRLNADLSWNREIARRFNVSAAGTYALALNRPRSVDINFDGVTRFNLSDDGRPVFVAPTSIAENTGSIAARDSRISSSFSRVSEIRSDLQSRSAQLSLRVSPVYRTAPVLSWNAAYTYTNVREQVAGFSNTAGDPFTIEWTRSGQGPHQISYTLAYRLFDMISINWTGSLRSGSRFTPMVAGDVNGDGYGNDRAFIYSPTSAFADSATKAGMQNLLDVASPAVRSCLRTQMDQIAGRNSCKGPWTSTGNLNLTMDRARFRMPQRANINFSISNPLGAADLLINGSNHLRGWGQSPSMDQTLLYVRGFDASTQRYRYQVNQRFGATRPQYMTLRSPVMITTTVRIDLGATRERQMIDDVMRARKDDDMFGGSRYAFYGFMGAGNVPNPMRRILESEERLKLTTQQADSLALLNRRYAIVADSIWSLTMKSMVRRDTTKTKADFTADEIYQIYLRARRTQVEVLTRVAPTVKSLLTRAQRRKLDSYNSNYLDPRYLRTLRNGTMTFLGGGDMFGGGYFGGGFGTAPMVSGVSWIER